MRFLLLILSLLLVASPAAAHSGVAALTSEAQDESIFTLEKLTDRIWALFGRGGNIGILVTDDGVVLIDSQYKKIAPGVLKQIRSLTDRPVRYLINTHFHADHTGGNPIFNDTAEIIAHHTVRSRILEYPLQQVKSLPREIRAIETEIASIDDEVDRYRLSLENELSLVKFLLQSVGDFDPASLVPPAITYGDRIRLWIGDQMVEVFHAGPAHTDGDSMVYFETEKVLHMGDIFFHGMYPFIDTRGGGSFSGVIASVAQALERAAPDARVIPGHGPVTDMKTLRRYHTFLVELQGKVRAAIADGLSPAEAVRTIDMTDYPEIKPLFRTLGNDVVIAYEELEAARRGQKP